jgi:amino acid adenylation domain-containing protein
MDDLTDRIIGLSPAKRALLELRLKEKSPNAFANYTIPPRASRESAPLSFAQQRLWFLDQLEPESAVYNIAKAIRMDGALNVEALQKALDAIVARHEILRTTITAVNGNPLQVVVESGSVQLCMVDLSAKSDPRRQVDVRRILEAEARRPFNLASHLMLRATLLRLGKDEHVLLLTTHHIASDGWSSRILLKELLTLYSAFSVGNPCPLPDLPIQYADYAVWQRQWLQGEVLERQVSYWKKRLEGVSTLQLTSDRPRPAIQSFRGARQSFSLTKELTKALKKLSQRAEATLFMTLLAAFKTLLFRYTRENDISVGIPVANRTWPETENLIGFFVNSLVLRSDLSGNPMFLELLNRMREISLGAYAHQDLPFERLVEELQPERSLSRTPLFQVMFGFQNVQPQTLDLPGLTLSPIEIDTGTAKFDLFLSMAAEGDSLRGSLEYNTDLFEDSTICRMQGHFLTLLEGITVDPGQRLSDLPILTDRETHQLLVEWNSTKREYPRDKYVHQLFEAQVDQRPDASAVIYGDKQLTYKELDCRANQLANYLQKLGVTPETLVGICVERSLEMMVGLLGILKAGGTYVPLDPAYPKERLAFMLEDAQAKVLLTQEKLLVELPACDARVVCLDTDWEVITLEKNQNPKSDMTANHLAYVIYTSGSTGKPKGVQIPHDAVVNFLSSMQEQPGLTGQDVLLAVTTISFDIAALELFLPLIVGATVVMVSREVAVDGVQLSEQLANSRATAMQATPATWRMLLEAGWQGQNPLKILCGGETLARDLASQLLAKGSFLWNVYGPTETTIWSSLCKAELTDRPISIGRPISNTQIYILDEYLQQVPIGVAGELYIGGAGLARGYLNHPELTAEKFIPNPFSQEPGARLYKTGDQARYLPDGNIEFLGRVDHQVKICGFRIELEEVESALKQHAAVESAAVIVAGDTERDKWLVAYIVCRNAEGEPTTVELRKFLRRTLPEYMIPSAFIVLDALPLTPSGKVNRRALPGQDGLALECGEDYVAPHTATERFIAEVWQEALGVDRVGVHDNFFDLGGHSLLSMKVIALVKEKIGQRIHPREMVLQTLGQLAAACEQRKSTIPARSANRLGSRLVDAMKKVFSRP